MRGPRLLLVLLVLAALALTAVDTSGSALDPLRRGADAVAGPAQRVLGGAARSAGDALADLPGGASSDEVERLRRDNDDLRRRLLALEGRKAGEREVAELLRLRSTKGWSTVLTRVVGYGAFSPFGATVTVDVGASDGVREGQTVTSGRGLVGRTVRVGPSTTTVVLLTDPVFSAGARVNRAPRSFGVARGTGDGPLQFRLVELPGESRLAVGDDLVTVGSEVFAPDVPVGRIVRVDPAPAGSARTAAVQPYADLGALDLLQVVVRQRPARPAAPRPAAPRQAAPTPTR